MSSAILIAMRLIVFFFLAEDGIRDGHVTGVQTCALPICHRVYKHGDSRVPTMKEALDAMIAHAGRSELMGLYNGLEQAMDEAKGIKPNVDYPAGPIYHLMGFDTEMFTPL